MVDFKSTIGFDSGDSLKELKLVAKAIAAYNNVLKKNIAVSKSLGATSTKIPPVLRVVNIAVKKLTRDLERDNRVKREQVALAKRVATANKAVLAPFRKTTSALKKVEKQTKRTKNQVKELNLSWRSVVRLFASQFVGRAFTTLTQALSQSVSEARELQTALAEIQTISKTLASVNIGAVEDITRGISADFGIPQLEVAKGLYQALSNQVGTTAETLEFLKVSANFAKATVSSLSDSVDLLSAGLNGLGLGLSEVDTIADKFFKTIELGRLRADDLSGTIGRVLPLANQLGVSLDQVAGALVVLTRQGISPAEAMTQLRSVMQKLIQPSEELKKVMDDLGVSGARLGIATFGGLREFLEEVTDATDGTIEAKGELLTRIRALSFLLGTGVNNGEDYAEAIRQIKEESFGAAKAAAELVKSIDAQELERNIQSFKNVFIDTFGNVVIGIFNTVIGLFGKAENAATFFLTAIVVGGTAATAVILTQLIPAMLKAAVISFPFLAANPFIAATIALASLGVVITAVLGGFTKLNDELEILDTNLKKIKTQTEANVAATNKLAQANADQLKLQLNFNAQALLALLRSNQLKYIKDRQNAVIQQAIITDSFKQQLGSRSKILTSFLSETESATQNAANKIRSINLSLRNTLDSLQGEKFDIFLRGVDSPVRKVEILRNEINLLLKDAQEFTKEGKFDQAKSFLGQARRLASQTAGITGFSSELDNVIRGFKRLAIVEKKSVTEASSLGEKLSVNLRPAIITFKTLNIEFLKLADLLSKPGGFTDKEIVKLRDRSKEVAEQIDEVIIKIKELAKQDTKNFFPSSQNVQDITDKFRGVFKAKPIQLSLAIDDAITELTNTLNATRLPLKVELLLGIEGTTAGPKAFAEEFLGNVEEGNKNIQKGVELVKILTEIEGKRKQIEATGGLFPTIITEEANSLGVIIGRASIAIEDAVRSYRNFLGITSDPLLSDQITNLGIALNKTAQQAKFLALAGADATKPLAELKAEEDRLRITGILGGLDNFDKTADKIRDVRLLITEMAEQVKQVPELFTDTQEGNRFNNIVEAVTTMAIKIEDVAKASRNGAESMGNFAEQTSRAKSEALDLPRILDAITAAQKRLNAARSGRAAVEVQRSGTVFPERGQARGGSIRGFALGGLARGTDTIPAMLSPGEFVINAKSSRRFFSELQSINAGRKPIYRDTGGPVTNNSFTGDINLNVSADRGVVNGRQAVADIRRELRRKTGAF